MKKNSFKRLVAVSTLSLLLLIGVMQYAPPVAYAIPANASCGKDGVTCLFELYINPAIDVLSVTAMIAVVIGIIWGGIQYSMSKGDPQKVTKAKATIIHALVGLVAFLLLGSFLQFLSPVKLSDMQTDSKIDASQGDKSTAVCVANSKFLGMKPWYAYLPDGSFAGDCSLKADVAIFPDKKTNKKSVLPMVLLAIADDMLRIAALIAVGYVIVGGVKYLTSQGEPQQTKMALSSIINALIGLAVAIFAAAIVGFIGGNLIK